MSPRTSQQNDALRADTQARLEEAALRVFARRGYTAATVREVAEEAGAAQGLLYNYYRGKDDLLGAVFRRSMTDVGASFAAADADAPPDERLARLIRTAFATVREHLSFWRLVYGVRYQPEVAAALGPALTAWTDEIRATLERHLRAAGHADAALRARLLFATIDGVSQHFALDPARYPLDMVTELTVRTFSPPTPQPGGPTATPVAGRARRRA